MTRLAHSQPVPYRLPHLPGTLHCIGACPAGGCLLSLACDSRIITDHGSIGGWPAGCVPTADWRTAALPLLLCCCASLHLTPAVLATTSQTESSLSAHQPSRPERGGDWHPAAPNHGRWAQMHCCRRLLAPALVFSHRLAAPTMRSRAHREGAAELDRCCVTSGPDERQLLA